MVDDGALLRSYQALRRTVGLLGVALPVILPIGVLVFGSADAWQNTISDYIGTVMRGVFVGALFGIGGYLFFYTGYETADDRAGNLACVFALGVALFPTNSENDLVRVIHVVSAVLLFSTLAYFSLFLFTKTGGDATDEKERRNRIYRACGITIVACIALIGLIGLFFRDTSFDTNVKPVFWLEAIALWAFGWAWFVKGEGIPALNDHA